MISAELGVGRTGRFGRKGCSVIFVHDERSKNEVEDLMARQGRPMKRIDATNPNDLEQLEKVCICLTLRSVPADDWGL
jgi:superfamily II DNA/RNA helicase